MWDREHQMSPEEKFSLKDFLFNKETVGYLTERFEGADPSFDGQAFQAAVMQRMPELELKQRITMIADVLGDHLSSDFGEAAQQIEAALPPPLDPALTDDDFGEFILAPLGEYVATNGLAPEDYETSIALLLQLTMRFSMEGFIRPFIAEYPDRTLDRLDVWCDDENYHVRRLVSEGTRPRLPWASRIPIDVKTPLPFLDKLHVDPTRYVTRSVANHLNDISKVEPSLALATMRRWHEVGEQYPDELAWMTNHALRTLVKQGHPEAMLLLGFSPDPAISVGPLVLEDHTVQAGQAFQFSIDITATKEERLLVDYVVDFVKKNGSTAPKVFKLKKLDLSEGDAVTVGKRHPLRANATTFTLYPGTHRVSPKINGTVHPGTEFELVV